MALNLDSFVTHTWNWLQKLPRLRRNSHDLRLGSEVIDERPSRRGIYLAHRRRPEHVAILGKTGAGKSSLLRYLVEQDIRRGRSFIFFDLHGDATPALLRLVAAEERRRRADLSGRLVIFDPADRNYSVGINILEVRDQQQAYVKVADLARILRDRWKLDTLGVRTEELLRNALHVLIENNLTIIELGPLLVDAGFRAKLLAETRNVEARRYFATRYNLLSDPMRALYREAVLNKITVFTSDPHFRHLIGQARSTVELSRVVEGGYWIIFNLDKGRLGEQAALLGSLLLTTLRHALFARRSRHLLTVYADELQNLVAYDAGLETLFSEARKLAVSVTSANQYLEQFPEHMRAALFSVGTMIFFQLSARDSGQVAKALSGGRHLANTIKNLPPRQMIVKLSAERPRRVQVPDLPPLEQSGDLYRRSRARFARRRAVIEAEINARLQGRGKDALEAWE
jgi:Helicase HerA, central domain